MNRRSPLTLEITVFAALMTGALITGQIIAGRNPQAPAPGLTNAAEIVLPEGTPLTLPFHARTRYVLTEIGTDGDAPLPCTTDADCHAKNRNRCAAEEPYCFGPTLQTWTITIQQARR